MNKQHTQFIKNPKTNRLVKVGGKTWRELVKNNILDGIVHNPVDNQLETIDEMHTVVEAEDEGRTDKSILAKRFAQTKNAREIKKKNKSEGVSPRHNRLAQGQIAEASTSAAIEIIKQNSESLAEELETIAYIEDEDEYNRRMTIFHKDVEQMIYQQLLSNKKYIVPKKEAPEYNTDYSIVDS